MYIAEIDCTGAEALDVLRLSDRFSWLLIAWMKHGQISVREELFYQLPQGWRVLVPVPEAEALDAHNDSPWAAQLRAELKEAGLELRTRMLGEHPNCARTCFCVAPSRYVVFTHTLSQDTPVRCGDCFGVVPLYRLPNTTPDETEALQSFASDWRACDTLEMHSGVLERAAGRQLRTPDSALGRRGRDLCAFLSAQVGAPFYYYLLGPRRKKSRPCPVCGGDWKLTEPWLHFPLRCDTCWLVSHEAW